MSNVSAAVAPTTPEIAAALGPRVDRKIAPVAKPAPIVPILVGKYGSIEYVKLLSETANIKPKIPNALPKERPLRPVIFKKRFNLTRLLSIAISGWLEANWSSP